MLSYILVMNFPRCAEADCNSYSPYRGFAGDVKPGWRKLKVSRLESTPLRELLPPVPWREQVRQRIGGAGDCFQRSLSLRLQRCSERESFKPSRLKPTEWRVEINKFLSLSGLFPEGGGQGDGQAPRPPTLGPGRYGSAGWAVEEKKRFIFWRRELKVGFSHFDEGIDVRSKHKKNTHKQP